HGGSMVVGRVAASGKRQTLGRRGRSSVAEVCPRTSSDVSRWMSPARTRTLFTHRLKSEARVPPRRPRKHRGRQAAPEWGAVAEPTHLPEAGVVRRGGVVAAAAGGVAVGVVVVVVVVAVAVADGAATAPLIAATSKR